MTTGYSGQQINIRLNNGLLINITGADLPELAQNVDDFIDHVAPKLDTLAESVGAVAAVGNALGATVVGSSPAPQASAGPAPAAPAAADAYLAEKDQWGNAFEHNREDAPYTPHGRAVLKWGKSQSTGNFYSKWLDPRHKSIPAARARGQRSDLADEWQGSWGPKGTPPVI